jgi:hypothetical protein
MPPHHRSTGRVAGRATSRHKLSDSDGGGNYNCRYHDKSQSSAAVMHAGSPLRKARDTRILVGSDPLSHAVQDCIDGWWYVDREEQSSERFVSLRFHGDRLLRG